MKTIVINFQPLDDAKLLYDPKIHSLWYKMNFSDTNYSRRSYSYSRQFSSLLDSHGKYDRCILRKIRIFTFQAYNSYEDDNLKRIKDLTEALGPWELKNYES